MSVVSMAWLLLWSTPLWADIIRKHIESEFRYKPPTEYHKADAIVVLGGGVRGHAGYRFPPVDLNRSADREFFASQLYKAGRSKTIILSGGADPLGTGEISSAGMKVFLINLGIPSRDIITGTKSRNTVENLKEVTSILKQRNASVILLVTSALHMKRAYWLFSKTNLRVIPAPTDFEVLETPFTPLKLIPDAEALENSGRAAREILGLWSYHFGLK